MAEHIKETPGQGLEGQINGRTYRMGRASYVGGARMTSGETELWFGEVGGVPVCFRFADLVRSDAAVTVRGLRRLGCEVEILSGDLEGPTEVSARSAGIARWQSQMTPQGKALAVEVATAKGARVLMVGDGLNDLAALSKAHAAMAPGTALDASQNAADLVFSGDKLGAVLEAIDVARAAKRRALENFAFAALYNLIAGPAAMLGMINPFIAALAMSGSSLVVTLNALRLLRGSGK
jgi:Cu2+-exporting ATPase